MLSHPKYQDNNELKETIQEVQNDNNSDYFNDGKFQLSNI